MGAFETQRLATVILAAGSSRRMGSSKALLAVGGSPALVRIMDAAREAGSERVVVVLGAAHSREEALADHAGATIVRNPHPEGDMFSSVRLGLAAVANEVDWTLLWPVDFPLVDERTIHVLLARARELRDRETSWDLIQPTHGGRGGHPILLTSAAAKRILRGPANSTLRQRLATERRTRLQVKNDPLVAQQANTPEEWQEALRLLEQRERRPE